jgi:hypothetical protein
MKLPNLLDICNKIEQAQTAVNIPLWVKKAVISRLVRIRDARFRKVWRFQTFEELIEKEIGKKK